MQAPSPCPCPPLRTHQRRAQACEPTRALLVARGPVDLSDSRQLPAFLATASAARALGAIVARRSAVRLPTGVGVGVGLGLGLRLRLRLARVRLYKLLRFDARIAEPRAPNGMAPAHERELLHTVDAQPDVAAPFTLVLEAVAGAPAERVWLNALCDARETCRVVARAHQRRVELVTLHSAADDAHVVARRRNRRGN